MQVSLKRKQTENTGKEPAPRGTADVAAVSHVRQQVAERRETMSMLSVLTCQHLKKSKPEMTTSLVPGRTRQAPRMRNKRETRRSLPGTRGPGRE